MAGDDSPEEAERRRQKRALEAAARRGDIPDQVHAFRATIADTKDTVDTVVYGLGRWSTIGRLASDSAEPGSAPGRLTDLGPLPGGVPDSTDLLIIGIRRAGRWVSITRGCEQLAAAVLDLERARS